MNTEDLINDVAFATALMSPSMIVALSPVDPDRELHFSDGLMAEEIRTAELVDNLDVFDHPLTFLARPLARHHKRRTMRKMESDQREVNQRRRSWFANHDGFDIDGHRSWLTAFMSDPHKAPMSPYQIKADGLCALYEALGNQIGDGDGDGEALGDALLNLTLSLAGEQPNYYGTNYGLGGGFVTDALTGKLPKGLLRPLSADERLFAITILSAWLRMARLGVDMTSLARWREWDRWFDGEQFGIDRSTIGTIWCSKGSDDQYIFAENWKRTPWLDTPGGSPVVLVGIAAELLKHLIRAYENSGGEHRVVVQLRRYYRELTSSVRGSAQSVRLLP